MNKILYIVLIVLISLQSTSAQIDPDFSLYNYNMTLLNPAYAGTEEGKGLTLAYQRQWLGVKGAPRSINASYSNTLSDKVGIGVNIYNNKFIVTNRTTITADFSYRVQVSDTTQLYFGLKAGGSILDVDLTEVVTPLPDPEFSQNINEYNFQVGVGVYLVNPKYYVTLSTPNFIKEQYEDPNAVAEGANFYMGAGYHFMLSENLTLTPRAMMRLLADFDNTYDIGASLDFYKKFTLGLNHRIDNFLTAYGIVTVVDSLRFGFSYDFITSELINADTDGSLHFILKYDF